MDVNETAAEIVAKSTKNPAAVELGRLGGLKGGKARADSLTPARRSEIAGAAAEKRWATNGKWQRVYDVIEQVLTDAVSHHGNVSAENIPQIARRLTGAVKITLRNIRR